MSFRLLTTRIFKHGRLLVQSYLKRDLHINILDNGRNRRIPSALKVSDTFNRPNPGRVNHAPQFRSNSFLRFGSQARQLFVDSVLNRVTNPDSSKLRSQAAKRLMFGDSTPFLSLVGVSLASGDGILTKEDELEAVCWEIRNAMSKFQSKIGELEIEKRLDDEFGLNKLDIGPPLAKGCSAVVYAAALKEEEARAATVETSTANEDHLDLAPDVQQFNFFDQSLEKYGPIFGSSVDDLCVRSNMDRLLGLKENYSKSRYSQETAVSNLNRRQRSFENILESDGKNHRKFSAYFDSGNVAKHNFRLLSEVIDGFADSRHIKDKPHEREKDASIEHYPLALKMMFNYDIQSNAMAILKAMYNETVPAKKRNTSGTDDWEKFLIEKTAHLPPHPNVVQMYGVFCDEIPHLQLSNSLYPMALPPRLNPQGYGRNMSLFLLMKRYNCSLYDYLPHNDSLDMHTRVLLFAQLLEAVAHLNRYGIAHRDLKSDNILIETPPNMPPILVLSDFGCCIADKSNGLHIPYTSNQIDKGGNTALMAPEIINKQPGTFSVLNYSKSDLWACGAIAYEIFGSTNPFYQSEDKSKSLRNVNYSMEELPPLPQKVPQIVKKLIENILEKHPAKRLSSDVAANVMQLFLWSPSSWLKSNSNPSSNEVLQWLLNLTTKILCENCFQPGNETIGRRAYTEYLLISSFLVRARVRRIKRALEWIHAIE
ncbi:serine/threonine-protein kinase Pink1, mitochondrial isoform X2 [Toxorhynchites rutilus septentrionalis]|uniref:serine/threonine-protein kinase Pink1, mitochondrial isoform X2 n=1 Tax=Toxorhynchites rutilus septentrionalis TaxID=329112 RepID=UPI00247A08C6|nr:serine/threonine-protein kinase Pink1, mitochondrial isoform X2 [Toxorhynchites rutilus septentrionalis]